MEFFKDDLDYPYRLLELNKIFTLDELKSQYKKMVLRYHPDKQNKESMTKTNEFHIITACYKYLLSIYHQLNFDNYELSQKVKAGQNINFEKVQNDYLQNNPSMNDAKSREKFNLKTFNDIYEKNKYHDPIQQSGYANFDPDLNHNSNESTTDKTIDPEPLDGVDLADCYELGSRCNNLGRTKGISKGLDFVDYKLAYTTSLSHMNDHSISDRKKNQSLEDLKMERAAPIQFSQKDVESMRKYEEKKKLEEIERIQLAEKQNADLERYYHQVHAKLMR